jgi:hypothetical protein
MKAATRQVEYQGMTFELPVGSLDKPSAESERIMRSLQNARGWKYPQAPYYTTDLSSAEDLAYCYDWHLGGHEIENIIEPRRPILYRVSSKGYYHYIGA